MPKEVVELSYLVGQDFEAIEVSYKSLIHEHFETLRQQRLEYLEQEWVPSYIKEWVRDGRLVQVASGEVVWSPEKEDFVRPKPDAKGQDLLSTVQFWALSAQADIESKEKELVTPLVQDEQELTALVENAFNRIYRANATVTAHLNSLREVEEVQDETLQALHLKDLRDQINAALVSSSDKAAKGLDEIRKADGLIKREGQTMGQVK